VHVEGRANDIASGTSGTITTCPKILPTRTAPPASIRRRARHDQIRGLQQATIAIAEHLRWGRSRKMYPPLGVRLVCIALIYASRSSSPDCFPVGIFTQDKVSDPPRVPLHWGKPGAVASS